MRIAIALLTLAIATALFGWVGGANDNSESADAREFDNHGAE